VAVSRVTGAIVTLVSLLVFVDEVERLL
jgi:hypothetical protein